MATTIAKTTLVIKGVCAHVCAVWICAVCVCVSAHAHAHVDGGMDGQENFYRTQEGIAEITLPDKFPSSSSHPLYQLKAQPLAF